MRVLHVAGARPNFMKVAPVLAALQRYDDVQQLLVHTGQHYDDALSSIFFDELGIPRPDVNLAVGSASHAQQTGRAMMAFEPVCLEWQPDLLVVYGDVNSTVACALVAAKLQVPVAHVEAGLRSFDWSMPEEINRVVTDRLSQLLFTSEPSANENLRNEGVPAERVHFVGNVMIDTLHRHREHARSRVSLPAFGVTPRRFVLTTMHRPANVDDKQALRSLAQALSAIAEDVPVLFPVHPRTRSKIIEFGLQDAFAGVRLLEPLGYLEFLGLMDQAGLVVTDSGGIQEETTALGVACITVRSNTERPVTVTQGTNRLVPHPGAVVEAAKASFNGARTNHSRMPEFWDGRAAERIAAVIAQSCGYLTV